MSTLWIFGDSFSVSRDQFTASGLTTNPAFAMWHEQLADKLGCVDTRYHTVTGAANNWILNELYTICEHFQQGDGVVLQLTAKDRRWFFADIPSCGNYHNQDLDTLLETGQYQAVQQYITHLHNQLEANSDWMTTILASEQLQNIYRNSCNFVVIPGWDTIRNHNGNLLDVSMSEFVSESHCEQWYSEHKVDPRPNHLSQDNHTVLCDKLVAYFKDQRPIDFTQGFEHAFLTV